MTKHKQTRKHIEQTANQRKHKEIQTNTATQIKSMKAKKKLPPMKYLNQNKLKKTRNTKKQQTKTKTIKHAKKHKEKHNKTQ